MNDDEPTECVVCQFTYETDVSQLLARNHLPLRCTHCLRTCCASCIGLEEIAPKAKCPHCGKKGIDRRNPAIALSLIKCIKNGPKRQKKEHDGAMVVDLTEDDNKNSDEKKPKEETFDDKKPAAVPSSPTSTMVVDLTEDGNKESDEKKPKEDAFDDKKPAAVPSSPTSVVNVDQSAKHDVWTDSSNKKSKPEPENTLRVVRPIQGLLPATQGGFVRRQDSIQRAIHLKLEQSNEKKEEQKKLEQNEQKSPLDRLPEERRKRAEAWLNANTDPETLQGRKVFRRGCHPRCISTILGGQGTHPFPIVNSVPQPDFLEGKPNPFIKHGEFYFAGRGDWNPWGPSFPGDTGLLDSRPFNESIQENFHLFVQCSRKPWEDHYQGRDARGKYLYLGKYRLVPTDPNAEVFEAARTFPFRQLSEESKKAMAEYYAKHYRTLHWFDGRNEITAGPEDLDPYLDDATSSGVHAWVKMLEDKQYRIEIVPVEFVEYDEDLYKALVDIEADNGQVSTRFEDIGPV